MKFVTFTAGGTTRPGAVVGEEVVDLGSLLAGDASTLTDLLEAGEQGLQAARAAIDAGTNRQPLAGLTIGAPVCPRTFFAIGLNYADHVAETGQEAPPNLAVFFKAPTSVNGPFDSIERPAVSDWLDYEGELGIVIGVRCRHVRSADAPSVIAGYTIVNDVSVRDWQLATPQWSLGKSFDTHGPIGPYVVTADEVGDPHALGLRTYVNGELRQNSNTEHLIFNCYDIVEILSQVCTLQPGDVIATGTPSGIAGAMEGQPWLVPGDRVRVEVDRLGAIENEITAEVVPDDFVINPEWVGGRGPAPAR